MTYYYDKRNDLVCLFDGKNMNFGGENYECKLEEDGITVHKWEQTYHFYPGVEHPRTGQRRDIHFYPIDPVSVKHVHGTFFYREKLASDHLLRESYNIILRDSSESPLLKKYITF